MLHIRRSLALVPVLIALTSQVRADAPPGRYTLTTETVYDTKTKLTWQRTIPSAKFNWADAKKYCADLATAGGPAWRLPTMRELVTISNYSVSPGGLDPNAFPDAQPANYWTSTQAPADPSSAWVGFFGTMGINTLTQPVSTLESARCVR